MKPTHRALAGTTFRQFRLIAGLFVLATAAAHGATINTQWNFDDAGNATGSVANVGGYLGTFIGLTRSASGQGVSDIAGDYSLMMPGVGAGTMMDATTPAFLSALNTLTGTQSMSITYWQNLNAISNSTAFWGQSVSASGGRGLNAHSPWSDGNIYYDTAGCCTAGVHRLSGPLGAAIGQWELITFVYDNGNKSIYRGTTLINSGAGFLPLTTDHTSFYVGNESFTQQLNPNARFDNFTLWNGALTPAEIAVLAVKPVPEPSVTVTLAGVLLAFCGRRRR
ncbi:MAG TPA: LamG-like jellyroll fold domain-containing protein [Verrucomicrobiales bacterium]|nr:LamG-like jellyroll fold domain-containing protein [Verrucomicrobiales bacterium]